MTRRVVAIPALVLVLVLCALPPWGHEAFASHFTNWLVVRAPFAGYWDRFGYANPATHHTPWFGDWATDFYQAPGAAGAFRISNSNGSSAFGIVGRKGSSCNGTTWAGWAYKFNVYDDSGSRGWYLAAHVSDYNGPGQPYQLQMNQTVYDGNLIGWTAFWGQSSCYDVSNLDGVHWHIEMYQPVHYSCWYPWSAGTYLGASSVLGAVGSNSLGKSSCW